MPLNTETLAPPKVLIQGYSSLERDDKTASSGYQSQNFSNDHAFIWNFCSSSGPPQVVLVTFLTTLSYGAIVALLPEVSTQRFAVLTYGYEGADCNTFEQHQQKPDACLLGSADAQDAHAFSEFVANILIVLTGSLIGSITDTHGRKTLFVLGTLLALLGNFAFLYVCMRPLSNPWVFYYTRSLHGIINWTAIALSAISDVMPPQLRAPAVGVLMAAYWFGVCIGPTIAAFLGYLNAVVFSCFVAVLSILFAVFFVPETVLPTIASQTRTRHRRQQRVHDNMLQSICWNFLRPFREISIVNRDGFFRLISVLAFFNGMVTSGDKILLLYYAESKLNFSMSDTAILLLLYGFGSVFTQGVILKPLNDFLGERRILIICFVTAILSNTCYGLATTKQTLYIGIVLGSFAAMAFPSFSAIKANNVDESEQGRVQGALYSILALASGVGPLVMRYVDHIASDSFLGPGVMFLFAAFLQLIAATLTCWLPKDRCDSRYQRKGTIIEEDQTDGGEELTVL